MKIIAILLLVLGMFFIETVKAWEVDMSRRTKSRSPVSVPAAQEEGSSSAKFKMEEFVSKEPRETIVDRQEIVILNTTKGFVPSKFRVRKGFHYLIHVVNVNKNNKNVSFMMDSFDQHHSTFFGETKTFKLDPNKEGVFEFQCPETSAEGRLIVYGTDRNTASE